jgi:hypothetical protein
VLIGRLSNTRVKRVLIWPFNDTHKTSAPYSLNPSCECLGMEFRIGGHASVEFRVGGHARWLWPPIVVDNSISARIFLARGSSFGGSVVIWRSRKRLFFYGLGPDCTLVSLCTVWSTVCWSWSCLDRLLPLPHTYLSEGRILGPFCDRCLLGSYTPCTRVATWATKIFWAEWRTLALGKFKYALESWRKLRRLRGVHMRSFSMVMRDEGFKVG